MVLNQKCGTKCDACETEQPGNERKLDVSVRAYGSEALAYFRIGAGGFKFGGLRLQGHPDGSSVSTIFEDLFTEEGTGARKAIFEVGFNFAASEIRNKLYGTASSVQREEDRSSSPSIQEYQNLEGKLKHNSTGE